MANQDPRETLLSWLNDAYAMEKGLVQVLENHAKDAKDHPEMHRKITEHLEKTKLHAERVEQCIARLGGSTSTLKTAMGTIAGFFQGRSTGAAPDELVKNGLSDYAAEHFEIASYRALIAGARALGLNDIVQVCEEILRDEEDMARWLDQQLPLMVQEYLGQTAAAGVSAGNYNPGTGNPGGVTRF
jgi:ferritin-like metal-binding protein YciE